MAKFKSNEQFIQDCKIKFPDIDVLDEYTSSQIPIRFKCNKHNYIFTKKPINFLNSRCGCSICARESATNGILKSHDWFVKKMKTSVPTVEVIGKYKGMQRKIKVRCIECGNIWEAKAEDLINGHGCKPCSIKNIAESRKLTNDEFIDYVKEFNPSYNDIEILSTYQGRSISIKCRCKICNHIWETKASNLIDKRGGSGCPLCQQSKAESYTALFLREHSIDYVAQKTFPNLLGINGFPLSYDFYIPELNLLIEIQGSQHYKPIKHFGGEEKFKRQQEHDRLKREYAEMHDIRLLEFNYETRDDLKKLEGFLKANLLKKE